jgi:hypothetical protein
MENLGIILVEGFIPFVGICRKMLLMFLQDWESLPRICLGNLLLGDV